MIWVDIEKKKTLLHFDGRLKFTTQFALSSLPLLLLLLPFDAFKLRRGFSQ